MLQSEFERNSAASLKRQMMSLALNPKVSVWVDTNILIGASEADKNRLVKFPNLRTIPQVLAEVDNKPARQRGFLKPFCEHATVFGPEQHAARNEDAVFKWISCCCKLYSPMVRLAVNENLKSDGSLSPVINNTLSKTTDDSTIFKQAEIDARVLSGFAATTGGEISPPDMKQLKQLKRSWLGYHRKREKGIRENTYIWTDELLVASALTDAFSNNCIAIILTTDWDPNVIMKQFLDNAIASNVDRVTQDPETWWNIFESQSKEFDSFLRSRRQAMRNAVCDGNIIHGCVGGDVFIWQFPSKGMWEFSFTPDLKNCGTLVRFEG